MPLVLPGSTSGDIQIKAPAVAGSNILTAPAETGTLRTTVSSGTLIQSVTNQVTAAAGPLSTRFVIDDTIPQNTEGTEIFTQSITPTSASNILEIDIIAQLYNTTASYCGLALFQDSTANAIAASFYVINSSWCIPVPLKYRMVAGTTSSTTFKVRVGGDTAVGNNLYLNGRTSRIFGGVIISYINIKEYAV